MQKQFCSQKAVIFVLVLMISLCVDIGGQTVEKRLAGKTISGGVINGKAKTLPKPEYPEAARKAGIIGQVKVQVLIDETGTVVSAKAVGGIEDVWLRQSSETAALQATFAPTLLAGQPAKVSGVITYNFVGPHNKQDELGLFTLSTFLTVAKYYADDAEKLKNTVESEDLIGELVSEFPEFSGELREVAVFHSLAPAKRVAALDKALSSIRSKVGDSERFQMDLGFPLGEILGPMMILLESGADPSQISSLDEIKIKSHLSKLKTLTAKPSTVFPKDVLEKLIIFAGFAERERLLQGENMNEFVLSLTAMIETISPEEK